MDDNLQWKTIFGGRRPLVEDNLWWKTTFGGRQPSVEDDLRWKMTFSGRRPSVEDNFLWKITFVGRQPLLEDDLWWKTTFGGPRNLQNYFSTWHAKPNRNPILFFLKHMFLVSIRKSECGTVQPSPPKAVFPQWSSSTEGLLPPKVILH